MEYVYRSRRFDEAIAQVKHNLGPNAFILSARQLSTERQTEGEGGVEIKAIAAQDAAKLGLTGSTQSATAALERQLRHAQVPHAVARALAQSAEGEVGPKSPFGADRVAALANALRKQLIFGGPAGSGARVVALVGPTGVGKTTTAAKLAAHGALIQGHYVALICIDLFRIGGAEQLERYAELVGIPMEVATDLHSLNLALRALAEAELVLIDTAGCSSKDHDTLEEMARCLHGVRESVEVHLCLDAAVREQEMEAVVDRYAPLQPVRLTVTKVDEAVCPGSIVAAQSLSGLPLAYLTTGQRVPQDIELATPENIAALICATGDRL